jgi:hypothetical protein
MKLVVGVVFLMIAVGANAAPDHGFEVPEDVSLVPVRVCPPGSNRPNIILDEASRCVDAENQIVDPVTPEQFLELLCPGAVITSLSINNAMASPRVIVGFDLPKSGCPRDAQKSDAL